MKRSVDKRNVYLKHIEEDGWNELHAYHVENSALWRNLAIAAILALAIVSIYAMYLVNQDKHKTVVFEKDSLGNITALGLATQTLKIDNKVIAHELANFILSLREVPQDLNIKRRNIDLVHKMIDTKLRGQVDQLLLEQYTKARDGIILVTISSIRPLEGGKSWQVVWHEKDSLTGPIISYWSSIITFKHVDSQSPETQLINPAGVYVTYLHPVQDVAGKGS